MGHIRMPDEVVHGGFEKVRECDKGADVGLNVMIFIFVNGLLTDADNIGKLLLADARLRAKFL